MKFHFPKMSFSANSHFWLPAAYPQGKYGQKYSAETKYDDNELLYPRSSIPISGEDPRPSFQASKGDDSHTKIARLTSIYEKAKADFEALAPSNTAAKLEAARFLRDTAENTIMYFRDSNKRGESRISNSFMAELEQTCKSAQASVVSLSGGRKRKFDRHDYDPKATRGGYPSKFSAPRGGTGGGFRGCAGRGGGGGGGGRGAKKWQETKREFRREVQPIAQNTSAERPFGYSRPVDSYQPGGEEQGGSHAHPYQQAQYGYETGGQRQEHGYGYGYGGYGGPQGGAYRRGSGAGGYEPEKGY
jgi:hypothetical protein